MDEVSSANQAEIEPATEKNPNPKSKGLTIDYVLQRLQRWRNNKTHRSSQIPDELWHLIFKLGSQFSEQQIRAIFGITTKQYQHTYDRINPNHSTSVVSEASKNIPSDSETKQPVVDARIKFQEVNHQPSSLYQPLDLPTVKTIVAEFCRQDGQVMKIHTGSTEIKELIHFFMEQGYHATNYTQS